MSRVLSCRYQLAIFIVAACLLFLLMSFGCSAQKGAQTQISSEQAIARQNKMNEMERKIETQMHRMYSLGFGTENQKYSNDVGDKANKNRRIEVRLLQLSQSQPVIP